MPGWSEAVHCIPLPVMRFIRGGSKEAAVTRYTSSSRGGKALALCLAGLLLSSTCGLASAKAVKIPQPRPTQTVTVIFRLQVFGAPAAGTTFWVAYGPLGGRFGLFQLRGAAGVYEAQHRLPAHGRTVFTYLAGQEVTHTRIGAVPSNPVITIASIGPTTALKASQRVVYWQAPAG